MNTEKTEIYAARIVAAYSLFSDKHSVKIYIIAATPDYFRSD